MVPDTEAREATRRARQAIYREAVAIVAAEHARPLTLHDVARRLATSPRQLQRAFAAMAGVGFRTHLRQVRMARAAELLADTDIPVKEIAYSVGYRDPSQFSKSFRRTVGVSPSEQRASGRGASNLREQAESPGGPSPAGEGKQVGALHPALAVIAEARG
jgi:AraC family transcriptional regulator of adaptative response / methylphosphotriester-DNA alkyltransferase methyltransferase